MDIMTNEYIANEQGELKKKPKSFNSVIIDTNQKMKLTKDFNILFHKIGPQRI